MQFWIILRSIKFDSILDPDKSQLDAAKEIGVDRVEIYSPFAEAFKNDETILNTYKDAIEYANNIGLEVNDILEFGEFAYIIILWSY